MNQIVTTGIVLARTDFGEADRILTMLTRDQGKIRLIAKGVRKVKSKLAGGIELFSVSDITFIRGRADIGTLISARLVKHYGTIVKDLNRTMAGYELIKRLNQVIEDEPEPEYFVLLQEVFTVLDDQTFSLDVLQLWFSMQLLRLGGHAPNLRTNSFGGALAVDGLYQFDFEAMAFAPAMAGRFSAQHIKFLRLGFGGYPPAALAKVQGGAALVADVAPLVQTMAQTYVR